MNKGQKYRYRHRAAPKAWSRRPDKGQKYRYPIRPQTTRLR
ncbi:hypothetical protein [Alicyclobacillus acidiphilus]|nr:hypothetical protein [Alicyclobacillus acidiphilus]